MSQQLLNEPLVERRVDRLSRCYSEDGISLRVDGAAFKNPEYLACRRIEDGSAAIAVRRKQIKLES